MAIYLELFSAAADSDLQDKLVASVEIAAIEIHDEDDATVNHANRLIWARQVLQDPKSKGQQMLRAVIAINRALTLAQILGASDGAIQTNVNDTVDLFADGS